MGRFVHEAAVVDPRTGIVYLTEDRPDSLFYRFLPKCAAGWRAAAGCRRLASLDDRERDLRNWPADGSPLRRPGPGAPGRRPRRGPLDRHGRRRIARRRPQGPRLRARARCASRAARAWRVGRGRRAQRDLHLLHDGRAGAAGPGLALPAEPGRRATRRGDATRDGSNCSSNPTAAERLKNCDNVAVTPWGGLILCEDGPDDQPQYLRGVTPRGPALHAGRQRLFGIRRRLLLARRPHPVRQRPVAGHHLRRHRAMAADQFLAALKLTNSGDHHVLADRRNCPCRCKPRTGLTRGPVHDVLSFPSGDGAKIVFQGNFDGRWQLYEIKASDGSIRRVHVSTADDTHPALSPDGKLLAFISNRDGNDDLWVLDRERSGTGCLTSSGQGRTP